MCLPPAKIRNHNGAAGVLGLSLVRHAQRDANLRMAISVLWTAVSFLKANGTQQYTIYDAQSFYHTSTYYIVFSYSWTPDI